MFYLRGKWLCFFISNKRIIATNSREDNIGILFDLFLPFGTTADIIHLPRDKIVHNICPSSAGIFYIIDDALVPFEEGIGFIEECVVDEFRDETPVGGLMLMRTIAIHRANPHGLCAKHLC